MSERTQAEVQHELDLALARIARLESTQKDLISEYFCDREGNDRPLTGLSETAKHFETQKPELCAKMCTKLGTPKMKIRDFNAILAESLTSAL